VQQQQQHSAVTPCYCWLGLCTVVDTLCLAYQGTGAGLCMLCDSLCNRDSKAWLCGVRPLFVELLKQAQLLAQLTHRLRQCKAKTRRGRQVRV
jgi:hypothetical protein